MSANGSDNTSLAKTIVLYQQELNDKLLQIDRVQQDYQLRLQQLQQLVLPKKQADEVVKKISALQQRSAELIPEAISSTATGQIVPESLRINLALQIAQLNAHNLALNQALAQESLLDLANKAAILQKEREIVASQLAMLERFAPAVQLHQQLLPLLSEQKQLIEQLKQAGDTQALLKEYQQSLPTKIARLDEQIAFASSQLAETEKAISRIAQKYHQAWYRYQKMKVQTNNADMELQSAQRKARQIKQQITPEYQAILNKCAYILTTKQKHLQHLQKDYKDKTANLQSLLNKRQAIKIAIENNTRSRKELEKNIKQAKIAKQKLAGIQAAAERRCSPESEIALQVALLKVETEINKNYLALDKASAEIKNLLSQSLAYGDNIRMLKKELPQLEQSIAQAETEYHQVAADIERQKITAQAKYAEIMAQTELIASAAQQKWSAAEQLSQLCQKEACRLALLWQLAQYWRMRQQTNKDDIAANFLNTLLSEAQTQISQSGQQLDCLWQQYQKLTNTLGRQWQAFQKQLGCCWSMAEQTRQQIDSLEQLINKATQKLKNARTTTDKLLTQQQKQQQLTQKLVRNIQLENTFSDDEILPLLQTANRLIQIHPKIPIIADAPYPATIPSLKSSAIYALEIDEPIIINQPAWDAAQIQLVIKNAITAVLAKNLPSASEAATDKHHRSSDKVPANHTPLRQTKGSMPANKMNSSSQIAQLPPANHQDIDIAYEQELRKRILDDLAKH